ncbi:hypothetical protein CWATWH0402_6451 [Crocosphaera watsonii WH 0402]|uniref:Uncharacterized protein n=1 Tax=Crocosphaera watsonii WH 0402 TaxID=1284629 RepID=T2JVI7_CROWT|nr:hypothetical protein CWATWH0402_6451 [Crocosphaera watsonii WH 0402]
MASATVSVQVVGCFLLFIDPDYETIVSRASKLPPLRVTWMHGEEEKVTSHNIFSVYV